MIINFKCKETEKVFKGEHSKKFSPDVAKTGKRKLDMLHASYKEQDLRVPPANRLEKLQGDLKGFYSIRINDQFRLIFQFRDGNAYNAYIDDYHK